MSGLFLTREEVRELTGYARRPAQVAKLHEWGIRPYISAKGEVFVTRDAVEQRQRQMSGFADDARKPKGPRPNLSVVQRANGG